ncbi:conserved exported hypothetical protein [Methylocella tundrae]|uniref:Rhamnogalacturonase A/B/Epimerase-like pectate lyase domain-containing protein n=1 Tax=Methylocella tundrae TaxID=227605 RepID=A0A8B6MB80_METTU|nr:conserved exported hypothetical protein [Methylocella tundrae]
MPGTIIRFFNRLRHLSLIGRASLAGCIALLCAAPCTAWAKATIINAPFTANPGDFISLEGSGFGAAPQVFITPGNTKVRTQVPVTKGQDNVVVLRIPQNWAFSLYTVQVYDNASSTSNSVAINAPQAFQFWRADIAPGRPTRLYGRNLLVAGGSPSITLLDTQTNAQLAASVAPSNSTFFFLTFIPPAGIVAGHTYKAIVSNGLASTTTEATVLGHAAGGDYFGVDAPWAYDFVTRDGPGYNAGVAGTKQSDHHIFNVRTDPSLNPVARGDGVTNDAGAIQSALDQASRNGGGIVYLPAGTYNLGVTGIAIRPGVVIQGHSNADTKIIFGPTSAQGSSFGMSGIEVPDNAVLTGIADLSIQNVDLTSQRVINLDTRGGTISKFFIQRVNWELGSGASIFPVGDRISIMNSNFHQAVNFQNGSPATGGLGPIYILGSSNLVFVGNTVKWATDQVLMNDMVNAFIESNHFTRSASDKVAATSAMAAAACCTSTPVGTGQMVSRRLGRQLTIQFGKNIIIANNIFDVSDGSLDSTLNDGETFLNESRGREDEGVVTSANSTSVSANAKSWNYYSNSMVIIVSGAGAGQWRHITQLSNNSTFTIDQPWDVVPAAGDHFTIAVPSFENAWINGNTMSNNPQGISLWAGAFLNTNVSSNKMTDNGGIYLNPISTNSDAVGLPEFSVSRNIEIKGNTLANINSTRSPFININLTNIWPNTFWGYSTLGVEVRNNSITTRSGTYSYPYPQGFQNVVYYQGQTPYVEQGKSALVGNIFQGNACINCPVDFQIGTGDLDTVIWNSYTVNSPGVTSTLLLDTSQLNYWVPGSIGTVIGHD